MTSSLPPGARSFPVTRQRGGVWQSVQDAIAEETPVALEFNGIAYATMLASPVDLADFALGFALTEGVITRPAEFYGVDIQVNAEGIVLQVEIATARAVALREHRRALAGRTGCGLCGVETLAQVWRPVPVVGRPIAVAWSAVITALRALREQQALHQATGATHAAALADDQGRLQCLREDVGRHNALDKLIGATARGSPASGMVVVSSRASYEMVHKTLMAGHAGLLAVSAPTSLAVTLARRHDLLLIGFVRGSDGTVYAGEERIARTQPTSR